MKRAIVLAHFDRFNRVAPYVIYYLKALKPLATNLIFVSTASLSTEEQSKVTSIADKVIVKENRGYDFGSWQAGIAHLDLQQYDELVICNDSVFGPLQPLDELFTKMTNASCDFWGITNSYDMGEHIQSYFVVFKHQVIRSSAFKHFWNSIAEQPDKLTIVQKYEIGLTQTLKKAGFKHHVAVPYRRLWGLKACTEKFFSGLRPNVNPVKYNGEVVQIVPKKRTFKKLRNLASKAIQLIVNPTQYCWRQTIAHKSPFIKVDLLRDNEFRVDISDWEDVINANSLYSKDLIREQLGFYHKNKVLE